MRPILVERALPWVIVAPFAGHERRVEHVLAAVVGATPFVTLQAALRAAWPARPRAPGRATIASADAAAGNVVHHTFKCPTEHAAALHVFDKQPKVCRAKLGRMAELPKGGNWWAFAGRPRLPFLGLKQLEPRWEGIRSHATRRQLILWFRARREANQRSASKERRNKCRKNPCLNTQDYSIVEVAAKVVAAKSNALKTVVEPELRCSNGETTILSRHGVGRRVGGAGGAEMQTKGDTPGGNT